MPLQITWPVLMANLMDWFSPQSVIPITDSLSVGDSLLIRPPLDATSLSVILPDGTRRDLPLDRQSVVFGGTEQTGVYRLEVTRNGDETQSQPFTVNLFDPLESGIAPQPSLQIGQTTITPGEREEVGQLEFWPLVALIALIILLIEWYIYQRRQRAPRSIRPPKAVPKVVS
jgi:Ca-activated chloride channel family protein